jgi:prepilin-type N-terminal cleavage/methylation domain-containing protein
MKNLIIFGTHKSSGHGNPSGYSLVETLVVVAVLSSVASAGYLLYTGLAGTARSSKLRSDVVTLNNAVRTYLTHGGKISVSDGAQVLDQLKTTLDAAGSKRLAGLRGSMIDPRLRGSLIHKPGVERAVWNPGNLRFELQTSGSGFSAFDFGGDPLVTTTEERSRTLDLAARDNWVWDFADGTVPQQAPAVVPTSHVATSQPSPPPTLTQLVPPDFSLPGTLYDYSAFNPTLEISLRDRNAPGEARIFYSINNGAWMEYGGSPLRIPPEFTTTVRAYASAVNSEYFEDSDQQTEKYETIYFTGSSSGKFHSPAGDSRLLTNLTGGLKSPMFRWGDPATSDKRPNELNFTGARFENVPPDKEFVVGELQYFNGTTYAGTNATSVQIAIDLDLTKPGVRESLNFTFKLLSTPNHGRDADADADYVYIPDVSTNFRTTIKGHTFALFLRFGEHGPNGFTTIDTFHAHEGRTLRGSIYGRLTAVN